MTQQTLDNLSATVVKLTNTIQAMQDKRNIQSIVVQEFAVRKALTEAFVRDLRALIHHAAHDFPALTSEMSKLLSDVSQRLTYFEADTEVAARVSHRAITHAESTALRPASVN